MDPANTHETARDHFAAVYDEYNDAIFRFCLVKVSNRNLAQDLTQETFMRFWQSLRKETDIQNERAFLYTLARNLVIDWYRKKKETSLDVMAEEGKEFASTDHLSITDNAEAQEVLRTIETLDHDAREVLLMRYVEGYSPKEIASILKETPNAISVRIHRAIAKVQDRIHIHET